LDPENRRQLWDILGACRGARAMVLTTHSMEEADVLCTRIGTFYSFFYLFFLPSGIMTNGTLRCIGTQLHLKSIYGGGYHLFVNCYQEKYLKLLKFRKKSLRLSQKAKERTQSLVRDKIRIAKEEGKEGELMGEDFEIQLQMIEESKIEEEIKEEPMEDSIQKREEIEIPKERKHEFTDSELMSDIPTLNISEVHQKAIDFIKELLPNALLLQSFNGNFIYEVIYNLCLLFIRFHFRDLTPLSCLMKWKGIKRNYSLQIGGFHNVV
jgi:hypothetical protein